MNRTLKLAVPLLLLALCTALSGASAESVAINAEDGGNLPDSILLGETFTVLITEDGPVGAGTNVVFTLPHDGGNHVYVQTDDSGKARYKPLMTGTLGIKVLDGLVTVAEATVTVEDAPVEIKAENGEDLPESIMAGETFTVLATKGGSPVPTGTNVVFTLPVSGGTPIFVPTDSDGKARYKPLITGTLGIKVLDGTATVAGATVIVEEIPVEIVGWTLDEAADRGAYIDATVTLKNIGTRPLWFIVSVSGTAITTGYPLIGLGTIQLDVGDTTSVPVMIVAPSSADIGEYALTPMVYSYDEYPAGDPEAIGSGKSVTIS